MSDLCWECISWLNGSHLLKHPHIHCHHEVKEEPKCICWDKPNLIYSNECWILCTGYKPCKFCPECGRKL